MWHRWKWTMLAVVFFGSTATLVVLLVLYLVFGWR
jgi:hypothetical protein